MYHNFIHGFIITASVFCVSVVFGTFAGLVIAAASISNFAYGRMFAKAFVATIRGVPELLIILLAYFGGTAAISAIFGRYVEVNAFASGVGALTFVFAGYAAEAFRGALNAIPKGQIEASHSLGLSRWQSWLFVIVPQMIPLAIPAYTNLCVSLIKDTALVSIVGLSDVMRIAFVGAGSQHAPLPFYLMAAGIYLACTSVALFGFRQLDRKYRLVRHS
ncbi:ABC transporter permease subunit [Neorhizobium sp. P12A]|uniref:ABC transporter permease subunit n=1 Tax=Neorhizobium sp. P12A TaxID=2268027 RepID=UPI0011EC3A98|nr:ABC transporter permease subunit [Neorhizobium sp. P12A]KAA0689455.1 ABC transporter permease subunit [Neorhizobium sp. P12A]